MPSRVLDVTLTRAPRTPQPTQFDYLSEQNQQGKPLAEKPQEIETLTTVSRARGEGFEGPAN